MGDVVALVDFRQVKAKQPGDSLARSAETIWKMAARDGFLPDPNDPLTQLYFIDAALAAMFPPRLNNHDPLTRCEFLAASTRLVVLGAAVEEMEAPAD